MGVGCVILRRKVGLKRKYETQKYFHLPLNNTSSVNRLRNKATNDLSELSFRREKYRHEGALPNPSPATGNPMEANPELSPRTFPFPSRISVFVFFGSCLVWRSHGNVCRLRFCFSIHHFTVNTIWSCFLQKLQILHGNFSQFLVFPFLVYPIHLFNNFMPCKHHFPLFSHSCLSCNLLMFP